jgi:hypothetical protein
MILRKNITFTNDKEGIIVFLIIVILVIILIIPALIFFSIRGILNLIAKNKKENQIERIKPYF